MYDRVLQSLVKTPKLPMTAFPPIQEHTTKFCLVIKNVLSEQECKDLIALTEDQGYEPALVNIGGGNQILISDYRNSDRCIIDSPEIAEAIYQRIQKFVPKEFQSMHAVGLNERLRFLRYGAGNFFQPHCDGAFIRGPEAGNRCGERSHITMMLYLNGGMEGGATRFFVGPDQSIVVDVVPQPGQILLFQHNILHEGSLVTGRLKYSVRTDMMYTSRGPGHEYSKHPIQLGHDRKAKDVLYGNGFRR